MTSLLPAVAGAALVAGGCGPGDDSGDTCSGLVAGDLVITEVLADYDAPTGSSGSDEGHEWFEIYNASAGPIELGGLTVEHGRPTDVDPKRHVMRPTTIPANGYLVLGNVLQDLAPDHVSYGYANDLGDLFNADGGRLALRCGTTIVDEANYGAATAGLSLELDGGAPPDYQANDDLANWCETDESAQYEYEPANFGTPGGPNQDCMVVMPGQCDDNGTMRATVPPEVGDLTITEVLPSPQAVSDTVGEWFEVLVNRDVDINNLALDRIDDTANPAIPMALQSATCVHATAGTYLVFAKNDMSAMNGGIDGVDGLFTFSLVPGTAAAPTGVRIMMGTTELDSMSWTSARNAHSIQLDMGLTAPADNDLSTNLCDGNTTYGAGDFGTPGMANVDCGVNTAGMCLDTGTQQLRPIVKPTAGQLVIDEWMPDPTHVADGSGEWFELRATADVDLNGLQAGLTTLGTTPIVPAGGDCVRLAAGSYAVFARATTGNGLPSNVTVTGRFGFTMSNTATTFQVGIDDLPLATATSGAAVAGSSFMLDTDGTQCTANLTTPAPVPAYMNGDAAGTDRGTPGAVNSPPECP
jgi:hypothetical protein